MKIKTGLVTLSLLMAGVSASNAALFMITNIGDLLTDRLYANPNGSLMNNTGLVTIGYFGAGVTEGQINTIPGLVSQLGGFTTVSSQTPGTPMGALGDLTAPGYADNSLTATDTGTITVGNPLLGRTIYSIITNASSIAAATSSSQFALVMIGTIADDSPVVQSYTSKPNNAPIIGTVGSFNGDVGFGQGTYSTLVMAIPETSSVLLGALGMLGLLRRRR